MWALYASGFKGVAIELDPDPDPKIDIQEVIYRDNPTSVCRGKTIEDTVLGIMSSKSRIWEYESEVRLFIKTTNKMKGEGLAYKAGSIRSVILGKPYETISNISEIYDNSELLKSYKKRAREILEIAKSKGVSTKISYITISPTGPVVTIRECNDGDFDD